MMTTIPSFVNRLKKIGVIVELTGNYPWVYLDRINGRKVKGAYMADHGFTVFMRGSPDILMDTGIIFEKIRSELS
jgi:hypothetical protein